MLVDADHGYDAVKADSEAAFRLVSDDGLILWHDFYPMKGFESFGVTRYLNDLSENSDWVLRHIAGTYYVVGSRKWTSQLPGEVHEFGSGEGAFSDRIVRLAQSARAEES